MPKPVQFTILGTPIAQPRARFGPGGWAYNPSGPIDDFRRKIAEAGKHSGSFFDGPVTLHICAWFPLTKREQQRKSPYPIRMHCKRPDIDNVAKAVMDALNGICWKDDGQVCRLVATKHICPSSDPRGARVSVQISEGGL